MARHFAREEGGASRPNGGLGRLNSPERGICDMAASGKVCPKNAVSVCMKFSAPEKASRCSPTQAGHGFPTDRAGGVSEAAGDLCSSLAPYNA
jgi:hypothetical protein